MIGLSWDLLWVFFALGLLAIAVHWLLLRRRARRRHGGAAPRPAEEARR